MITYFLSKFFPLLIMPLLISIFINLLNLKKKNNFIYLFSLFLLIFFSNKVTSQYLWQILEKNQLENIKNPIKNHNFAVILGGAIINEQNNRINWIDPDKFYAGLKLLKDKKINQLIVCDGFSPFFKDNLTEGQILKREAKNLGFSSNQIILTKPVMNTIQEVLEIESLLEKYKIKDQKIILISNAFHMDRATYLLKKKGIETTALPVNFNYEKNKTKNFYLSPINYLPNASSLSSSSDALREILAKFIYMKILK